MLKLLEPSTHLELVSTRSPHKCFEVTMWSVPGLSCCKLVSTRLLRGYYVGLPGRLHCDMVPSCSLPCVLGHYMVLTPYVVSSRFLSSLATPSPYLVPTWSPPGPTWFFCGQNVVSTQSDFQLNGPSVVSIWSLWLLIGHTM